MKFSKYLERNADRAYLGKYLEYSDLKSLIQGKISGDNTDSPNKERFHTFKNTFEKEFIRIFTFVNEKTEDFKGQIRDYEESKHSGSSTFSLVQDELKDFAEFIRINIVGFKKLLKYHDKKAAGITNDLLYNKYRNQFRIQIQQIENLDQIIYNLSRLKLQQIEVKKERESSCSFIRRTEKYWVHNENLMALKMNIVRNLPVYVFDDGDSGRDSGKNCSPFSALNHLTHDTSVSSVYFDNDSFDLYFGRLKKNQGAEAIRIRWYGQANPITYTGQNVPGRNYVFIERKKHSDSWTGDSSKKLRFKIDESLVNNYIKGMDVWDHVLKANGKDVKQLYSEIQSAIVDKSLKPKIRTFYKRIAFQLPNDSSVRISLDTNLCMIKEDNIDIGSANWRRTDVGTDWPFRHLQSDQIVRFPHSILEVKTQSLDESKPEWIETLINSSYVEHVHKFSKFIHGAAILFPEIVDIPYWLPQMKTDIRKDSFCDVKSRKEFNNDPSGIFSSGINNLIIDVESEIINSETDSPVLLRDKRISIPVRVEPKVFFANERTFLSWVQFAIFLGGIGTAMMGIGDRSAAYCGMMLIVVSIIFAFYSLFLYYWRAEKIRQKDAGPYDDLTGPFILVGMFVVALLLSVYFKFPMKK